MVSGLRVTEGVLLFGKKSLLLCEGFTLSPAGDVCCRTHHPSRYRCTKTCDEHRLRDAVIVPSCQCHMYTHSHRSFEKYQFILALHVVYVRTRHPYLKKNKQIPMLMGSVIHLSPFSFASVRDSFISSMLSKELPSARCRHWLYEDIKEAHFMHFLLEVKNANANPNLDFLNFICRFMIKIDSHWLMKFVSGHPAKYVFVCILFALEDTLN